ncbi:MAG: protein translocase subunit SecD [Candidatus Kerfeldbacteria bacterium]|nr:protein translocase subunit SecD [Candidatus Kerfeldbacteria bacterium]
MTVRRQLQLMVLMIVLLTVGAAVVDYPQGPNITWRGELVRELKIHLGLDLQGGTSLVYQADVSQVPADEVTEAMAGVRDVIERRINAFGVSEAVVQTNRVGENWRVIVELPGVTDVNAAVKQIGETPLLEFKVEKVDAELTDEQRQFIQSLNEQSKQEAQTLLDRILAGEDFAEIAKAESQDDASGGKGGDLGYFGRGDMVESFEQAAFAGTVGEVIPNIVESDYGYHIIKVVDHTTGNPNTLNAADTNTAENDAVADEEVVRAAHILIKKIPESIDVFGPQYDNTELTGRNLKRSEVQFDPTTNQPVVALQFDDDGSKLFEDITKNNVGKTVAIYLDGSPISTPLVNEAISGGQAVIQGEFTLDEAKQLARRLNAGALPVKIELVNQRNVGPTLGEDAIQRSVTAGILGVILLAIFMIAYYRWPGLVAVLALGIYTLVLLAVFKLWPVTLTLAGVAGFIFSLGVAVDANVLIFERLKEELRQGKALQTAIDDGFKRAWLSIRDSNVSSLITCFILSWFGTSIIKGFAVTLALGIIISMFSAITVTRTLLKVLPVKHSLWYGVKQPK